jgi:hypothetical protein
MQILKAGNMNKLYIDQIARRITDHKYSTKSYFQSDIDQGTVAVTWMISYLDKNLRKQCLNSADTGICDLTWKHEDCRAIMNMLFDLTQDDKYLTSEWVY